MSDFLGDTVGNLGDFIGSQIQYSTASNQNAALVENARAQAMLIEVQAIEQRERREQLRKDKLADTLTTILVSLLALGAVGFLAYLIIYIRKNSQ